MNPPKIGGLGCRVSPKSPRGIGWILFFDDLEGRPILGRA